MSSNTSNRHALGAVTLETGEGLTTTADDPRDRLWGEQPHLLRENERIQRADRLREVRDALRHGRVLEVGPRGLHALGRLRVGRARGRG